jgi:hypothetical protein
MRAIPQRSNHTAVSTVSMTRRPRSPALGAMSSKCRWFARLFLTPLRPESRNGEWVERDLCPLKCRQPVASSPLLRTCPVTSPPSGNLMWMGSPLSVAAFSMLAPVSSTSSSMLLYLPPRRSV